MSRTKDKPLSCHHHVQRRIGELVQVQGAQTGAGQWLRAAGAYDKARRAKDVFL